jgi:hypothetical protein
VLFCATAYACADHQQSNPAHLKQLPPAEYDHPYVGKIIIERMTQAELRAACPGRFTQGYTAMGCTDMPHHYGANCTMRILDDSGLKDIGWLADYDIIYRHERGHCNGWIHHQ